MPGKIERFLAHGPYAVVGASADRAKYGNKVLRCYLQHGLEVYAVHPREQAIEGVACYRALSQLPRAIHGISVVTPPQVTEQIVEDAPSSGARYVWMQPGAESLQAITRAESLGLQIIAQGPCILVVLGFRESSQDE